jgi:acyl-CoA synthetase (AMP-forming)/AMP-acid ligase II
LVASICQSNQATEWPGDAVSLAFLPMFHAMGFVLTTLGGLAQGVRLVTLARFEPQAFLQAIATHRVTHVIAVPPVMQFMARHPLVDQFDLSSLQRVGAGGAPMSAALEALVSQRLHCPCGQGYGMTETSAALALGVSPSTGRAGSVGQVVPGTQARVVDPDSGADLPRGQDGELWFRGPQLFSGYLNNPQATAATLTDDGWIRTGDLGRFDVDGYLFITDRLKELIKVKGLAVAPAELEALLMTHPAVADAAVIGRPDDRAGEVPVAYLVARGELDPDALNRWLAERVAPHKRLADMVLVAAIPKSPSGKLLRRLLREQDVARIAATSAAALGARAVG